MTAALPAASPRIARLWDEDWNLITPSQLTKTS